MHTGSGLLKRTLDDLKALACLRGWIANPNRFPIRSNWSRTADADERPYSDGTAETNDLLPRVAV